MPPCLPGWFSHKFSFSRERITILKQAWTPKFRISLISWYEKHHRALPWRKTGNPYAIWISEVMLQQTQVATVIPYYERFLASFPHVGALALADMADVLKKWEGLGYYARARHLHKAANILEKDFHGKMPRTYDEIRQLPGVGDYIASAVLSIAFGLPHAVVDGNVKRVLSRLLLMDEPVNVPSSHNIFKKQADLLLDTQHPGTFNQALMELGALVCTPKNPHCSTCPVCDRCRAFSDGIADQYPKRIKSGKIPEYHVAVGVVFKKDRVLITRRKPEGLLGGLWEFPGGKVIKGETPEQTCIREMCEEVNLDVRVDQFVTRIKHAYTHFKIIMDVFTCRYASGRVRLKGPVDFKWIKLSQIKDYAFPKANHKFLPALLALKGPESQREN
jgi:A/G-specific adenine glycosylase